MSELTSKKNKGVNLAGFEVILMDIGNVIFYDFTIEMAYSFYVHEEITAKYSGLRPTAEDILWASKRDPQRLAKKLESLQSWSEINSTAWSRVLDNWDALCIPIPGALETLRRLSHLRLAIIANQPREMMLVLDRIGITYLFEEIILDSSIGFSKPDTAIYKYAAHRLRARPETLVMIGDRLDNDILPAKAIGMKTIWIDDFPLDESLFIPFVSDDWKNHYLSFRTRVSNQYFGELPEDLTRCRPDAVLKCLADLID